MAESKITDHVGDALDRLPKYLRLPGVEANVSAFLASTQSLEDAAWDAFVSTSIDTATGAQLDLVGRVVGVVRNGLDDEPYRRRLRATILARRSDGTVENLIGVLRNVLGTADGQVVARKEPPAASALTFIGATMTEDESNDAITFLDQAVSAGDRVLLEYQEQGDDDTFMTPGVVAFLDGADAGGNAYLACSPTTDFPDTGGTVVVKEGATETTYTYTSKSATRLNGLDPVSVATEDRSPVVLVDGVGAGFGDEPEPSSTGGAMAGAKEVSRRRDTIEVAAIGSGVVESSTATPSTDVLTARLNPQRHRRIFVAVAARRSGATAQVPTCASTTPPVSWNLVHSAIGSTDDELSLAIFEAPIDPDVVPLTGLLNSAVTFTYASAHAGFAWVAWYVDGASGDGVAATVSQPVSLDASGTAINLSLADPLDPLHMTIACTAALSFYDDEAETHAAIALAEADASGADLSMLVSYGLAIETFTATLLDSEQHLVHYYEHFTRWDREYDS